MGCSSSQPALPSTGQPERERQTSPSNVISPTSVVSPSPSSNGDGKIPSELDLTEELEYVRHDDGSKSINGFLVKELLGAGSFGKVKLVEEESSGNKFAMKIYRKGVLRREHGFVLDDNAAAGSQPTKKISSLDKVRKELRTQKGLLHPHCIKLFKIFDSEDKDGKMYAIMEFAENGTSMEWDEEHDAFYVPKTGGVYEEREAKSYARDTLLGLIYLHGCGIAHRDIKPQNLLLSAENRCKLADFGTSTQMSQDGMVNGTDGTFSFFAPETCITDYKGHDGRKADIWALGVTLWAFIFGTVPFFCQDLARLFENIEQGDYKLPDAPTVEISVECERLLRKALSKSPADRPLAAELLKDIPESQLGAVGRRPSVCSTASTASLFRWGAKTEDIRYYAVWYIPDRLDVHGVYFGQHPHPWDFLRDKRIGGTVSLVESFKARFKETGSRIHRCQSFDEALACYKKGLVDARRRGYTVPDEPEIHDCTPVTMPDIPETAV